MRERFRESPAGPTVEAAEQRSCESGRFHTERSDDARLHDLDLFEEEICAPLTERLIAHASEASGGRRAGLQSDVRVGEEALGWLDARGGEEPVEVPPCRHRSFGIAMRLTEFQPAEKRSFRVQVVATNIQPPNGNVGRSVLPAGR